MRSLDISLNRSVVAVDAEPVNLAYIRQSNFLRNILDSGLLSISGLQKRPKIGSHFNSGLEKPFIYRVKLK